MDSTASPAQPISAAAPDDADLRPLEPGFRGVIRIGMALGLAPFAIGAIVGDYALYDSGYMVLGMVMTPVLILYVTVLVLLPGRRWRHWGYHMAAERLRVVHGFLFRTDTIVPFNRIQHIDVAQGPVERLFGVATLVVHTAGTHNSTVSLPGLRPEDAEAMREEMRGHIRQEMI